MKFAEDDTQLELIRDALTSLITQTEIDATIDRLKSLAEVLKDIIEREG